MQLNTIHFGASLLASGLGLATLLAVGQASAQEAAPPVAAPPTEAVGEGFGSAGTFSIAAERLMGLSIEMSKTEIESGGVTDTDKLNTTHVALLGNMGAAGVAGFGLLPRLGFDYFVIDGLSVGTAFVVTTLSGKYKSETTGQPDQEYDLDNTISLLLHPRVGYALMFNDMFGIWPRLGITYGMSNSKSKADPAIQQEESKLKSNVLDVSVEVPVVITPVDHFAIFATPFADIGVAGKTKYEETGQPDQEQDRRISAFGLAVGIGGYF